MLFIYFSLYCLIFIQAVHGFILEAIDVATVPLVSDSWLCSCFLLDQSGNHADYLLWQRHNRQKLWLIWSCHACQVNECSFADVKDTFVRPQFCMRAWKTHLRGILHVVMHNYLNFHAQIVSVAGQNIPGKPTAVRVSVPPTVIAKRLGPRVRSAVCYALVSHVRAIWIYVHDCEHDAHGPQHDGRREHVGVP